MLLKKHLRTKGRIMGTIENHQVKITVATAVIVVLFLIATSVQFATWKTEMQASHREFDDRITHLGETFTDLRTDIDNLNEKANQRDIQLATINTKLANIEALLLEIKADLKDK